VRPSAVIELKFDTSAAGRAPLGDIASSLVCVDELLRDLATIAAYPSSAEFREIRVAAMTMRSPMKVTLSLLAIPEDAVRAFQEICRQIIVSRERQSTPSIAAIEAALTLCAPQGDDARVTPREAERIHAHIATLRQAEVPLKEVVVKNE
jgi:hypothetical protein